MRFPVVCLAPPVETFLQRQQIKPFLKRLGLVIRIKTLLRPPVTLASISWIRYLLHNEEAEPSGSMGANAALP
jgi:hypothetical protein